MRIKFYTQPDCRACRYQKRMLLKHGYAFEEINIQASPAAYEHLRQRGVTGTPHVEVLNDAGEIIDAWTGFKPTKVEQLKELPC